MLAFKIIKMDRVFEVIYKAMSYSVICQISYEILFMFLSKLSKYIYTLCTVHTNVILKLDTSYIKCVKWKVTVTQLQPFAQSATFKLLSL